MNHDEATRLLQAYRDGELDLSSSLKVEEHMAGCQGCQQELAEQNLLVDLVQAEALRFPASPFLKTRIRAALRGEQPSGALGWWRHRAFIPFASVLGVVAVLVLAAGIWPHQLPEVDRDAIADHVRSLQVNHLMDVASTDQHTVKPWFAGKLDYSPPVFDFVASGYPLVGGRLDVLDHRNVAAIIYGRRKHFINLFVWPTGAEPLSERLYRQDGFNSLGWTQSGMNYLVVSELGTGELKDFVQMMKSQLTEAHTGE